MRIELPSKFKPLFSTKHWLKIFKGGRGSGKSRAWAAALILRIRQNKELVLNTREIQKSIKDSSKRLIENEIDRQGLRDLFKITNIDITYIPNGSEIVFHGLKMNVENINSLEGVTICVIEEARLVSQQSIDTLFPTIRAKDAEIWVVYNPKFEDDPIHKLASDPPPGCSVTEVNYPDNPFFPELLRKQMEWMRGNDYEKYKHIWLGQTIKHSEAQVLYGKWVVEDFETPEDIEVFYFGADWGFAGDPTVLTRCWIDWNENILYVDYEAYAYNLDLENLPAFFDRIPGSRDYTIRADNSRPETIKFVMNKGFKCIGATKGPGSIEDGISFLRSFKTIKIHTRCPETAFECSEYKHKEDPLTGDILPIILDKHNHGIDSLRYSTRPLHGGAGEWETEVKVA